MVTRADFSVESGRRVAVAGVARHAVAVGIAGLVSGVLIGGVGGRLLMRIAAVAATERVDGRLTEAGARVGEITLGGSLAIVLGLGLLTGGIGAVLFVVTERWLAWAGRYRGAAFGVFLLLIGSATSDALDPDNFDFALVGNQGLVVGMFVALFVAYGALISPLSSAIENRLPDVRPEQWLRTGGVYVVLALFGLQFAAPLVAFHVSEDACGCEPQYLLGGLLLLTAMATALVWASEVRGGRPWRAVLVVGYAALVAASAVGGRGAAGDIVEIVFNNTTFH